VKPTFVVDVSDTFERKLEAIRCYASQFDGAVQAGEVFPNGEPLYDVVRHQARTTARSSAAATASRSSPPRRCASTT
jgi:LmbE family N-acetylglucosaminyl deacetylase